MDIAEWLRELGLGRYEQALQQGEIDPEILLELTDADLKELGIPLGPRKKLLKAIAALADGPEPTVVPQAEARAATEVASTATPPQAERRQLTVMFCDLVGSTELSTRLDPEDMAQVIRVYQNRCSEVVERWGGHVARYMGDGILVYFGYPHAHEDDPERAVRAALGLPPAVAALTTTEGKALAARVGIATGLVMVGDPIGGGAAQEEVVGETPNLAARLQGVADPGAVVIGATTRRLIGGLFELRELDEQRVKGFSEPVRCWQVVGEVMARGRFEALRSSRLIPLAGREAEISLLLRRWDDARRGEGQVVLLSGEAGIGKSRLARSLLEALGDHQLERLRFQCSPFHVHSALHPMIAHLEEAAGFAPDDDGEGRLNKLEAMLAETGRLVAEATPLLAALLSLPSSARYKPLDLSPDAQKARTFEVLLGQLEAAAARRPVLIVFEDAHWIDPTTTELIGLIIEHLLRLPVLLLITCRPDFTPPWRGRHVSRLSLARLGRRHVIAMVEQLTGGKALPTEVLEQIVERTDGVPLFVEELTKAVLESGLLTAVHDHYALAKRQPTLSIPATLHDSLMARLDRLGAAKEVAQTAAVIGREFAYDLLAAALGWGEKRLADAFGQLIASELVFRRGKPPAFTYSFKHALVQDVAYQSLLRTRRQQLHGCVAQVLLERFPETVETAPELLAHHYTEARLPAPAITYWRAAGERAAARSANAEAADHLASALRLLPALPEDEAAREELDLQLMLGFVLLASRGFGADEVGRCYWRAVALCQALGERQKELVARFGLWRFHLVRGEFRMANQLALELKQAAEQHASAETRLISDWAYGVVSFWLGRLGAAKVHLERAAAHDPDYLRDLAPRYAANPGVTTRLFLSWTLWLLGEPERAVATMAEALDLAEPAFHAHSRAWTAVQAAVLHQFLGDVGATRKYAEMAIDACDRQRIPHFRVQAVFLKGWALAASGEQETGITEMERALEQLQTLGNRPMLPYFLTLRAEALASEGRTGEALSAIEAARAESAVSTQSWCNAEIHRVRGAILRRRDDASALAAEADLMTACEISRSQRALAWELRAATTLADLWTRCGRSDEARALLAPLASGVAMDERHSEDLRAARVLLSRLDERGAELFAPRGRAVRNDCGGTSGPAAKRGRVGSPAISRKIARRAR